MIKEPKGEIEESFQKVSQNLKKEIVKTIQEMNLLKPEELVEKRYEKFRNMGEFKEEILCY